MLHSRFEVADALKMDYDKQSALVDDICSELPSQDFPDDENPYHKKMRARGEKMYHLVKLNMGNFMAESSFSQTLQALLARMTRRVGLQLKVKKMQPSQPPRLTLLFFSRRSSRFWNQLNLELLLC